MANPQAPKFDFLRIFLIATLVFIGFQLFMQRPPEDARTSQEIKAKMLEQNRDLMDVSIQQNSGRWSGRWTQRRRRGRLRGRKRIGRRFRRR